MLELDQIFMIMGVLKHSEINKKYLPKKPKTI